MQTKTLIRALSLATVVAATPLTFTKAAGLTANEACAQGGDPLSNTGTCCPAVRSICNAGGLDYEHYYYKSEGPC